MSIRRKCAARPANLHGICFALSIDSVSGHEAQRQRLEYADLGNCPERAGKSADDSSRQILGLCGRRVGERRHTGHPQLSGAAQLMRMLTEVNVL
jgi:hypothetical protein